MLICRFNASSHCDAYPHRAKDISFSFRTGYTLDASTIASLGRVDVDEASRFLSLARARASAPREGRCVTTVDRAFACVSVIDRSIDRACVRASANVNDAKSIARKVAIRSRFDRDSIARVVGWLGGKRSIGGSLRSIGVSLRSISGGNSFAFVTTKVDFYGIVFSISKQRLIFMELCSQFQNKG